MFATPLYLGYISAHTAQRIFHDETRTIAQDQRLPRKDDLVDCARRSSGYLVYPAAEYLPGSQYRTCGPFQQFPGK